jgi:hypothetical protein
LGGQKSKDMAQNIFGRQIFKREEFSGADSGPLGLHSVYQYAATHVRICGVTKDKKMLEVGGKGEGE